MERKDQNEFAVVNDVATAIEENKTIVRLKKYTDRRKYEYKYEKSEDTCVIMRDIALKIYKTFRKIDGAYQVLMMDQDQMTEYLLVIAKCKITHIIEMDEYNNLVDTLI